MRKLFATPEAQPTKKENTKDEGKKRAEDRNTGKQTSVFPVSYTHLTLPTT